MRRRGGAAAPAFVALLAPQAADGACNDYDDKGCQECSQHTGPLGEHSCCWCEKNGGCYAYATYDNPCGLFNCPSPCPPPTPVPSTTPAPTPAPTWGQCCSSMSPMTSTDVHGSVRTAKWPQGTAAEDPEQCCGACQTDPNCVAWVYSDIPHSDDMNCWTLSSYTSSRHAKGEMLGVKSGYQPSSTIPAHDYVCAAGYGASRKCFRAQVGDFKDNATCAANCAPPPLRYDCGADGTCVTATTGHASQSKCQDTCQPATPDMHYTCGHYGNCFQKSSGEYATQADCQEHC